MASVLRLSLISLASIASFFLLLFVVDAATGNEEVAGWAALVLGLLGTPLLLLYFWRAPAPSEPAVDGFAKAHRAPRDREDEIAKLAESVLGSSYVVLGLLGIAAYAVAKVLEGKLDELLTAFMLKALIVSVLYVLSLVLVGTLRGKSTVRRVLSWGYSLAFHAGLLVYLGVFEKVGEIILVLCIPELFASILSLAGVGLVLYGHWGPQARQDGWRPQSGRGRA